MPDPVLKLHQLSLRALSFKWQGQTSKELKEGSRSLEGSLVANKLQGHHKLFSQLHFHFGPQPSISSFLELACLHFCLPSVRWWQNRPQQFWCFTIITHGNPGINDTAVSLPLPISGLGSDEVTWTALAQSPRPGDARAWLASQPLLIRTVPRTDSLPAKTEG